MYSNVKAGQDFLRFSGKEKRGVDAEHLDETR
jgi:hypothetical protein